MNDTSVNITSGRLFLCFLKLGMTAFGGPAMIAHMKGLAVRREKWLGEKTFKEGVVICQTLPGATAMQMAAYIGLKAGGTRGAFASYIGFGIPAFLLMLTLAIFYAGTRRLPQVISLFSGLQVMVVAIIAHATFSFGRGTLKRYRDFFLTGASALLFWCGVNPFAVIIGAAAAGMMLYRDAAFAPSSGSHVAGHAGVAKPVVGILLLAAAGLAVLHGADRALFSLAVLLLKIDLFAFGGGFASLPLMFHEIVDVRGWLDGKTFMDGIALGQVTPGPIVITATFVGYLLRGLAGAVVATLAMFTPSFVLLVALTPFLDRLKDSPIVTRATKGILASFVGLLLYMTVKFAMAVPWEMGRVLFGLAAAMALTKKINIFYVVLIGAAISVLLFR